MVDERYKPFGSGTIEGAFLNDIEYAFDSDEMEVTIRAAERDRKEIDAAHIDLEREQVGVKVMHGEEHPIVELHYVLTVPIELMVRSGDDVVVDGFEATWTFEDVNVRTANSDTTVVITEHIDKSYGETGVPDEYTV